ncbi:uncharacterized protein A1O9_08028 [Exophiala aquamarina CBS 119918]|uniref:HMG box domain-containing protein n=1 Tax=Exophiala aquamarina CBS 119918 TaxID=1182545 RepID=A0A072P9K8_9EURO|nr:uncharacterized protein A1O9_08028 [Exophiala aquamarina CBS 119918]KEF56447.1 hypothetical protein A1O9_08028 [Exophiala aquamarina CBS 119918]
MPTSHPAYASPDMGNDTGIQTRSGRALGTPSSPGTTISTRRSKSPRIRARKNTKNSNKKGGPVIDAPLSELTKDYKTPVRDMSLWANRPVEERMAEVDRKKGYISRPMNSFMLYRSAYADRVKQFCKENNHQVVSQITGASWPLEPREVREFYEHLAILERDNHAAAHPNYKFAPNKSTKRERNDDVASDSDPDWEGSTRGSKRSRSMRRFESRSASATPFDDRHTRYHHPMPSLNLSGYEMSNPYGPTPLMIGPDGFVGQYYQASMHIGPYGDQTSDIRYERLEDPFQQYQSNMDLVGLPTGGHHELLASQPPLQQNFYVQNDILDPRLGQYGSDFQLLYVDDGVDRNQERTISFEPASQVEMQYQPEAYHPGLVTLTEEHDVWGDSANMGNDFDSEFQKLV